MTEDAFFDIMPAFMIGFLAVYLVFFLILLAVSIVAYVLCSMGYMNLGKAHRLQNTWMAWVPVCNVFFLARLADDCARRLGKQKGPGRMYIISFIASLICWVPYMLCSFLNGALTAAAANENIMLLVALCSFGFSLLYMAIAFWQAINAFLCLWNVYRFWDEQNAVLYLLLSIFVSAQPVILLILGNRAKKGEAPRSKEAKAAAEAYMQAVQAEQAAQEAAAKEAAAQEAAAQEAAAQEAAAQEAAAQEAAAQEVAAAFDVQPVAAPEAVSEAVSEAVCEIAPQATPEEAVAPIVAEAEQPQQPLSDAEDEIPFV